MDTPFRFGLSASRASSRAEWRSTVDRVAAAGFDTLLVPDHFGKLLSVGPALTAAAAWHPQLRVGSFVYDNDFRHPALLAQEAATLATITDGRFELGIGAGWMKSEYDQTGIPWESGRVRVEKLEEAVILIKRLLNGDKIDFEGRHYRVRDLEIRAPAEPPRIVIGGGRPRLLRVAARFADVVSIMPGSLQEGGLDDADASGDVYERKVELLAAAAGDRFPQIELNVLVQEVVVTDDSGPAADALAQDWGMPREFVETTPLILIGTVGEIADRLEERRQRFGFSYISVFEKDLDTFAPVIVELRRRGR